MSPILQEKVHNTISCLDMIKKFTFFPFCFVIQELFFFSFALSCCEVFFFKSQATKALSLALTFWLISDDLEQIRIQILAKSRSEKERNTDCLFFLLQIFCLQSSTDYFLLSKSSRHCWEVQESEDKDQNFPLFLLLSMNAM